MVRTAALCVALAASLSIGGCDDDTSSNGDAGAGGDLSTPPVPQPLARFAVIGDFGVDTSDEMDVAKLVKGWGPDYIVTVGDNNYPNGEADTIDANIGQYFAPFIGGYTGKYGPGAEQNRFWPALGNHDWYATTGDQPYLDYFPSLPGNKRYYDVVVGNVHFFAIDSDEHEPDGIDATSTQAAWLEQALTASTSCFNIVYFHHPPYSSGQDIFVQPRMRWPFLAWGADVVLTGHQHHYERLLVGGLTYVVDGLGGALNRFPFNPAPEVGSLVRYNGDFGALFAEVYDGGRITFTFRNTHGVVIDRFDVARDCSAPHNMFDAGL
ncbi:MAG TPA: metallophosphoesterase [Polyangia bacterium]|nr:metallophosphoesterase [Polyangia bacterium]